MTPTRTLLSTVVFSLIFGCGLSTEETQTTACVPDSPNEPCANEPPARSTQGDPTESSEEGSGSTETVVFQWTSNETSNNAVFRLYRQLSTETGSVDHEHAPATLNSLGLHTDGIVGTFSLRDVNLTRTNLAFTLSLQGEDAKALAGGGCYYLTVAGPGKAESLPSELGCIDPDSPAL